MTGGPGGGKSSLIADVLADARLCERVVILPEAIHVALRSSISPREPLFQRLLARVQRGLEDAMVETLGPIDNRLILTHRGTLDPYAFCRARGWSDGEFWQVTGLARDAEYARYAAVIHLVSTAIGVPQFYRHRPEEHRPETPEEAAALDQYLTEVWSGHPCYHRIENDTLEWPDKSRRALDLLRMVLTV